MGDRRIIFCFQKNDTRNHSQYDLSISVLKLEIGREVSGKTGMKLISLFGVDNQGSLGDWCVEEWQERTNFQTRL